MAPALPPTGYDFMCWLIGWRIWRTFYFAKNLVCQIKSIYQLQIVFPPQFRIPLGLIGQRTKKIIKRCIWFFLCATTVLSSAFVYHILKSQNRWEYCIIINESHVLLKFPCAFKSFGNAIWFSDILTRTSVEHEQYRKQNESVRDRNICAANSLKTCISRQICNESYKYFYLFLIYFLCCASRQFL